MPKENLYEVMHVKEPEWLGDWDFWVHMHVSLKDLNEFFGNDTLKEAARTVVREQQIQLHFAADEFNVGLVAHEATHACLWQFDRGRYDWDHRVGRKRRKNINVFYHPEVLAERIGNLTAFIWYRWEEAYGEHSND